MSKLYPNVSSIPFLTFGKAYFQRDRTNRQSNVFQLEVLTRLNSKIKQAALIALDNCSELALPNVLVAFSSSSSCCCRWLRNRLDESLLRYVFNIQPVSLCVPIRLSQQQQQQ